MTDPLTIRPATPADASHLAWTMVEAQRGGDDADQGASEWDVALPGSEDERRELLAAIACEGLPHPCHVSRFLVAEREGRFCGALSGTVGGVHTWDRFRSAWFAAFSKSGFARDEAERWLTRLDPFMVVRVVVPEDAWRVEWVATRPEQRGRGVVARLLEALLVWARDEGHAQAVVATAIENAAAIRAYERAGFARYAEWRHADYASLTRSAGDVYLRRAL